LHILDQKSHIFSRRSFSGGFAYILAIVFAALFLLLPASFFTSFAVVNGGGGGTTGCQGNCLGLSPNSGTSGITVDVSGFTFSTNNKVTGFTFDGTTPSSQTCTSQTTDLYYGAFQCNFIVPNLPPGSYDVQATVNGMTGSITFTITASAPSSFDLQFAATGLDSTAVGSVVTFPTGEFTPASFGQLPVDEGSVTSGTAVSYAFASTLLSSNPGEQFALTNTPSPASGFKISADTTVTGSYQKQDRVQFAASPNGGGTTTTSGWYADGSSGNPISATPSGGFSFAGWTVLCVTGSSCITISGGSTITVNGPGTLIATFLPPSLDQHHDLLFCRL